LAAVCHGLLPGVKRDALGLSFVARHRGATMLPR
jgi:hypothetical protein